MSRTSAGKTPGQLPSNRPARSDVGNYLGISGGVAAGAAGGALAGGALGNRPSQLPANRGGFGGDRPREGRRPAERPQERGNWSERSLNRNENWSQRVDQRSESWQKRDESRQGRRDDFQKNRDDRWSNIEKNRNNRQDWRNQNREDWQQHRKEMWDYRYDRADEVWDNCRDYYDDCFDDHWWGGCGWGYVGHYPANPWWWWVPATVSVVNSWVYASSAPPPVYADYGTTVVYEGGTVYVDNKPVPAEKYNEPILQMAAAAQAEPPAPPTAADGQSEWLPLGVFALVQEEKGDPIMFFQISISKDGKVSGGYENALTGDRKPIAGQIDKTTQTVAWRIGENVETVFASTLGNLTQDVSTVAIHFGKERVQTWLLIRMPPPAPADQPAKAPEIKREMPPATPIPVSN